MYFGKCSRAAGCISASAKAHPTDRRPRTRGTPGRLDNRKMPDFPPREKEKLQKRKTICRLDLSLLISININFRKLKIFLRVARFSPGGIEAASPAGHLPSPQKKTPKETGALPTTKKFSAKQILFCLQPRSLLLIKSWLIFFGLYPLPPGAALPFVPLPVTCRRRKRKKLISNFPPASREWEIFSGAPGVCANNECTRGDGRECPSGWSRWIGGGWWWRRRGVEHIWIDFHA